MTSVDLKLSVKAGISVSIYVVSWAAQNRISAGQCELLQSLSVESLVSG